MDPWLPAGAWLLDVPVWLSTDAWLLDVPVWLSVVVGRNRKKSRRFAEVTVAVSDICGFLLAPNGDTSHFKARPVTVSGGLLLAMIRSLG